ncbi:MAG: phosphodiester glycosidase family protein [Pseudomonadota bacterium]
MKRVFVILLILFCAGVVKASPKPVYHWNKLDKGVLYTKFSFEPEEDRRTIIHAFQLDPNEVKFQIVLANSDQPQGETAKNMAKQEKANLVINGGFFTPEHKSIGLLVNDGKVLNPLHKTSWWSIFVLKNNQPSIVTPKEYQFSQQIQLAIQAGPRLVIDGFIPKLKEGLAARTAIGITGSGKVVLLVTDGTPISLTELAKRMKMSRYKGGLECANAMALDGGGSSQLYANIDKFEISLPGVTTVTNGIAVFTH